MPKVSSHLKYENTKAWNLHTDCNIQRTNKQEDR